MLGADRLVKARAKIIPHGSLSVSEFEVVTIPQLSGESHEFRLTLFEPPFLRSKQTGAIKPFEPILLDHDEYFDGDFWLYVHVGVMFACGSHTMKLKEHLPRLFHPCMGCRAELSELPQQRHRFQFELKPANGPAFRVDIEAPAVHCTQCGRWAILWSEEASNRIQSAIVEALSGANGRLL